MGDAVRDGDVHAGDLEDTIDAQAPGEPAPAEPARAASSGLPVQVIAATRDYQELLAVDRHHYAITREIARGGIGRVFEARDLRLGRQVAIKELLPKNRDAARRFEREARVTARLQHPAIIHVYEAGVWPGGEPFYAMPLVAGRSLDKVVAEKQSLNERLGLLPNVIAVADALAYAHNANVIHRDLKPANVLVGEFGETVVIDWGLAKDLGAHTDPKESLQMRLRATGEETVSGSVVGTPTYMPPEQARGEAVDQRSDVYALGALLYKVLCGAPPYTGTKAIEVLEQVKAGPPVPIQEREPDTPPDLVAIVAKAMARNPDDRYITASELAQDLKRFETGQLVGAHRYTMGELVRRWLRRHRVAVSIASIALVVLVVVGVISVRQIVAEKRDAQHARDGANEGRRNLLEERGRTELLAGHAGAALAYLVGASDGAQPSGVRGFLIADAKRPFEAELTSVALDGNVVVAASPDGRHIAMAGTRGIELRAPDNPGVRLLAPIPGTHVLVFDASSAKVAAGGADGVARVWTLDGTLIAELRDHRGAILAATFTRDGNHLVTAGEDAVIRVWDLATRSHADVQCQVGPVVSARLSPDGEQVLTASTDSTACIINIKSDHPISPGTVRQLKGGHTAAINDAIWSPDGALVVTASNDGTARVWSARSGKPVVDPLRHDQGTAVQAVAMSTDGLVVTAGNDLVARVWVLPPVLDDGAAVPKSVKPPRRLVGHAGRIMVAAISADDRQLVTAGFDGLAKVWDLHSGQEIATFEHGDAVGSVAFVRGAPLLVSGSQDGKGRIWKTQEGESYDLDSAVKALAIAPDGTLAAGREDSVITLIRGASKAELSGHDGSVLALAFSSDGKRLISAGVDESAIVWDAVSGKQLGKLGKHEQATLALAIMPSTAPSTDRVAMLVDGSIEIWTRAADGTRPADDIGTRVKVLHVPGRRIDAIAVHAATGAVAGVGRDGTLMVWDADGNPRRTARDGGGGSLTAVTFAPSGDALITAGPGGAQVWKLALDTRAEVVGELAAKLDEGDTGEVHAVLVTPDGSRVITAGDTGRATIWDRAKAKLLHTRGRHVNPINAIALHEDTLWLASEDHTLSGWHVGANRESVAALRTFMDKYVSVQLEGNDVVRKR